MKRLIILACVLVAMPLRAEHPFYASLPESEKLCVNPDTVVTDLECLKNALSESEKSLESEFARYLSVEEKYHSIAITSADQLESRKLSLQHFIEAQSLWVSFRNRQCLGRRIYVLWSDIADSDVNYRCMIELNQGRIESLSIHSTKTESYIKELSIY